MTDQTKREKLRDIKEALTRFKLIVDAMDCECDSYIGYMCTVHDDRILAKKAIDDFTAIEALGYVEPLSEEEILVEIQKFYSLPKDNRLMFDLAHAIAQAQRRGEC